MDEEQVSFPGKLWLVAKTVLLLPLVIAVALYLFVGFFGSIGLDELRYRWRRLASRRRRRPN